MTTAILLVVVGDILLSLATLWMVRGALKEERDRSDKYAAALLFQRTEAKAAQAVQPPKADEPPDHPLARPQQIGLTPR